MAAFMGKDVKKLKAKGGGKVSNSPSSCFLDPNQNLSRKTHESTLTSRDCLMTQLSVMEENY